MLSCLNMILTWLLPCPTTEKLLEASLPKEKINYGICKIIFVCNKYKFPWRRGISGWWLESLFPNESCANMHRFPNCVRTLIHSRGDTYPCNLFWIVSALGFYAQGKFFVRVTSLWASSLTGNGKKVKGNDETPSTCTCPKWTIQDIRETVHNGESGGQSALLMCNLTTIYGRNVSIRNRAKCSSGR